MLHISNEGRKILPSVIPQVEALDRKELCGAWWTEVESGGHFSPIGEGVPLAVGASRTLVLAVRYHYPEAPVRDLEGNHEFWYAVTTNGPDYLDMLKVKAASSVNLGERVLFRVRVRGENVDRAIFCEASTEDGGNPVFREVDQADLTAKSN